MSIVIHDCPFCGSDSVELDEVSPSEFALICTECRCIGPIAGDLMSTIGAWNKSVKTDDLINTLKAVKHYFTLCDTTPAPAMSLEEEQKLIDDITAIIQNHENK